MGQFGQNFKEFGVKFNKRAIKKLKIFLKNLGF